MREIELKNALRNRCADALKNLLLTQADQAKRQPLPLPGFYLPAEDSAFVDDTVEEKAPFILVRAKEGVERERDQFSITTEIIIQIFNDSTDYTGDTDLLLCMNRIRDNILNKPILDNIFQYDGGFRWLIAEEQPFPNWEISITMNWLIPNPQRTDYNEFI